METCKICGGTGAWLSVNSENICKDCASPPAEHEALTVYGTYHDVLCVRDGSILICSKNGEEKVIPISSIQDIAITPPKNLYHGAIKITTAKPNSGILSLGSGIAAGFGAATNFTLAKNTEIPFAKAILDYIISYNSPRDSANNHVAPTNAADQLRSLKSLLDDGTITQEEFDAKKRLILGI